MKFHLRAWSVALGVAFLTVACGGPSGQPAPTEEPTKDQLVMGLVPSAQAQEVLTNAQPITEYLSKEIGVSVKAQVPTSYAAVVEGMTSNNVDIAWLGPLSYLAAHQKNGAEPMTKSVRCPPPSLVPTQPSPCIQKGTYPAIIIARTGSGINSLSDLKGKKFAFGDADSTSSNLWPRYYLKQNGIDPDRDLGNVASISSQSAIAAAVYNGTVDAGAMFGDARLLAQSRFPDILTKTQVIFQAPQEIPGDPQVVRKGLNSVQKDKVRQVFIKLGTDPSMKPALRKLFSIDTLEPAKDSDYDPVRRVVQAVNPGILGTFSTSSPAAASPSPIRSP